MGANQFDLPYKFCVYQKISVILPNEKLLFCRMENFYFAE